MRTLLLTALHAEAKSIIARFGLKQDLSARPVPVFTNDRIGLAVGGVGKIKASIAATYLLARQASLDDAIIFNIGIAGSTQEDTVDFMTDRLTRYLPEEKIAVWM